MIYNARQKLIFVYYLDEIIDDNIVLDVVSDC